MSPIWRRAAWVTSEKARLLFAEVVLPHLDTAYALARWLTGNRSDAEDVVQDACLRALNGLDLYAGGNARAWVLTIVRNTAFTWLARNRPKAVVLTDDIEAVERERAFQSLPGNGEGEPTPEAALIAKADAAELEAAIASLPPPFKETIVLRDINGLSYREIAEVTKVPIGTVMSRLARGRNLLIGMLGRGEIGRAAS